MSDVSSRRIGPPLTNHAHWARFKKVLRQFSLDESILSQLDEMRSAALLNMRSKPGSDDEAVSLEMRRVDALTRIQGFFLDLERGTEESDPLYKTRKRVHAPLLATIEAALQGGLLECPACKEMGLFAPCKFHR